MRLLLALFWSSCARALALQGTVAVNKTVSLPHDSFSLIYAPVQSTAKFDPTKSQFVADCVGDFVLGDTASGEILRWTATDFAATGLDAPSPSIFSDTFSNPSARLEDSDSVFGFWAASKQDNCHFQRGPAGLQVNFRGSVCWLTAPGFVFTPFSAWHNFSLQGLDLLPGSVAFAELSSPDDSRSKFLISLSSNRAELRTTDHFNHSALLFNWTHNVSGALSLSFAMNVDFYKLCVQAAANPSVPFCSSGAHGVNFRSFGFGQGSATVALGFGGNPATTTTLTAVHLSTSSDIVGENEMSVPAMPAVLAPVTDAAGGAAVSSLGLSQPLSEFGILDVTADPFNADPTGHVDSTLAIQRAVDYARSHYSVVFFPVGNYAVSDTIVCQQTLRQMATGDVPGPRENGATPDFLLDGVSSRYVPNYLRGSLNSSRRATLILSPNSAGFDNPDKPKNLVEYRMLNTVAQIEPNAMYNFVFMGIDPHGQHSIYLAITWDHIQGQVIPAPPPPPPPPATAAAAVVTAAVAPPYWECL